MATSRREQLVETALTVFNRDGYHAAGIDRILAEAGVAKMTLYNHFRSKDDLILAALRRRDEGFRPVARAVKWPYRFSEDKQTDLSVFQDRGLKILAAVVFTKIP